MRPTERRILIGCVAVAIAYVGGSFAYVLARAVLEVT